MKYLPSILALIAANLVPLFGVIFFGWDAFSILILYWLESAVTGFYTVLKLDRVSAPSTPAEISELRGYRLNGRSPSDFSKEALARFFIFHYGGFMLAHALFLAAFIFAFVSMRQYVLPPVSWQSAWATLGSFGALFASHGYSYAANFIGKEEYMRISPAAQLMQPYRRIGVMHLAIVLGAAFLFMFRSATALVITMIAAKILIDIFYHLKERHALSPRFLGLTTGSASFFTVRRPHP